MVAQSSDDLYGPMVSSNSNSSFGVDIGSAALVTDFTNALSRWPALKTTVELSIRVRGGVSLESSTLEESRTEMDRAVSVSLVVDVDASGDDELAESADNTGAFLTNAVFCTRSSRLSIRWSNGMVFKGRNLTEIEGLAPDAMDELRSVERPTSDGNPCDVCIDVFRETRCTAVDMETPPHEISFEGSRVPEVTRVSVVEVIARLALFLSTCGATWSSIATAGLFSVAETVTDDLRLGASSMESATTTSGPLGWDE